MEWGGGAKPVLKSACAEYINIFILASHTKRKFSMCCICRGERIYIYITDIFKFISISRIFILL